MELPPEETLRWIATRYAALRARHGHHLAAPALVEPTSEFFPDPFDLAPDAIDRLLRRTLSYAPLPEDLPVELAFVAPEDAGGGGGGCGSGACSPGEGPKLVASGTVAEGEDRYVVALRLSDVGNPVLLTASLSRATGRLIVLEGGAGDDGEDEGAVAEIAAVAAGLGLLLLNGACVYAKGCGGLRAHQATRLDVPQLAVALALFCRVHGHGPGVVRRHLAVTQGEAFAEAMRWVDSNGALVDRLRDAPELLEGGAFDVGPTRSWLARWLSRRGSGPKSPTVPLAPAPRRPAAPRSEAEARKLAEARALVEEALREP